MDFVADKRAADRGGRAINHAPDKDTMEIKVNAKGGDVVAISLGERDGVGLSIEDSDHPPPSSCGGGSTCFFGDGDWGGDRPYPDPKAPSHMHANP